MKKYYPEILVFSGIFIGLLTIIVPALSWMSVNSDVAANILAAKYFYTAHGTGEPLYVLLNHLFLYIPLGSDSWRLGFLSTLATLGGMIFIYLTVRVLLKENKKQRLYAIVASIIYGTSMLVVSQSGIVQLYTLITMFSLGAFYFTVKKKWILASVMIGLGLATAHLILITWLVLIIAHKELRNWRKVAVSLSFLAFYAYLPISKYIVGAPDNWVNTSFTDYFRSNITTALSIVGNLAIYDLPKRLLDIGGIVGVSLGLALIPIVYWLWKTRKLRNELLWLFVLPIMYFAGEIAPDTSKYQIASIGFGAIIAALGLSKLNIKILYATAIVAIGLFAINLNAFDIGKTIDPQLSAQKFYDEELPKLSDGDIFLTNSSWQWQEALLYIKQQNKNIIPICIGTLSGEPYLKLMESKGVKLERNTEKNVNIHQGLIAKSIIELNPNVWMDVTSVPETYGAILIKGDNGVANDIIAHASTTARWNFKPSNPYSIVSGSIQIREWAYLTLSNYSVFFFVGLGSLGLIVNWFVFILPKKKVKDEILGDTISVEKKD